MKRKKKSKILFDFVDMDPNAQVEKIQGCCGALELMNLDQGPVDCLAAVANFWRDEAKYPLCVFTDNVSYGHGKALAAYIRRHELGSIIASKKAHNPNHGSFVQAWVCVLNKTKFNAWVKAHIKWYPGRTGTIPYPGSANYLFGR